MSKTFSISPLGLTHTLILHPVLSLSLNTRDIATMAVRAKDVLRNFSIRGGGKYGFFLCGDFLVVVFDEG